MCVTIRTKPLQDHPRRCGENRRRNRMNEMKVGSPPQVRGKRRQGCSRRSSGGITPAGAGKTAIEFNELFNEQDHPRRCGENRVHQGFACPVTGSPPQVRGKRNLPGRKKLSLRITPAGAGKTFYQASWTAQSEDHPRRCGENALLLHSLLRTVGSPPQVRGKRGSVTVKSDNFGITPAGAGKTVPKFGGYAKNQDHPRRCGENAAYTA